MRECTETNVHEWSGEIVRCSILNDGANAGHTGHVAFDQRGYIVRTWSTSERA